MMGALWDVLHASLQLRPGRMRATYVLTMTGVLAVLVATLVGGFGAAYTFLPPLPFYPAGKWSVWSQSAFFVGMLLVDAGFCVYLVDGLEQTTTAYGGLARRLGLHYLRGREAQAPPPQAIAATVVAIDGLIAGVHDAVALPRHRRPCERAARHPAFALPVRRVHHAAGRRWPSSPARVARYTAFVMSAAFSLRIRWRR
jgi:hypothetical protein